MTNDLIKLNEYLYEGKDLGATYNKNYTLFKVWAPTRNAISVILYDSYEDRYGKLYPMIKGDKGVWEIKIEGDLKNKYYNYIVTADEKKIEIQDPYTKGAAANGKKGMIVDFKSINPKGWDDHKKPKSLEKTQVIIYEMHVRDFSINRYSGIKNKGKYLAFTEKGTKGISGISTGLDHLIELGITHIHLLPIFDFASIDETKNMQYNWGYDPYLYNVPEGSYATNPYDGTVRIREFKEMIKTLHENNIGVIMDVVYNHTYGEIKNPFDILVPKYYYRTDINGKYTNGSGCGNEIASEKAMVRKFIVDSVKFWASEYKIDGFRFDLMALHDIYTMRQIEEELKNINPNILIYGEPWTGGDSSLAYDLQFRKGKQRGTQVSVFNDDFRNAIKGDNDGYGKGFVNGGWGLEFEVKKGIIGGIKYDDELYGFSLEPGETVNYVSCHDNLTLFDKIKKSNPEATEEEIERMNRLALAIILTSQGIPFIQGGTEFLRTKKGSHNSYNAGDKINSIEWERKSSYHNTFKYIKNLIILRKNQRVMTLSKAEDIRKSLRLLNTCQNTIMYLLKSPYKEDYSNILIIHNANSNEVTVKLPIEGEWKVIANEYEVNHKGVSKGTKAFINELNAVPLSTYILYKD